MKVREIIWSDRYSSTMEDDKFGRWARIAHIGEPGFKDGMPTIFELAWIKKLDVVVHSQDIHKFEVVFMFPAKGRAVCDTLDEAKNIVEEKFQFFISNCLQ